MEIIITKEKTMEGGDKLTYKLYEQNIVLENIEYKGYGISVSQFDCAGNIIDSYSFSDITTLHHCALYLLDSVYENDLYPCHLADIIEDYFGMLKL